MVPCAWRCCCYHWNAQIISLELFSWYFDKGPSGFSPFFTQQVAKEQQWPMCSVDTASSAHPLWEADISPFTPLDFYGASPNCSGEMPHLLRHECWKAGKKRDFVHGNEDYHKLIAVALAWNMFGEGAKRRAPLSKPPAVPGAQQRTSCFGDYGAHGAPFILPNETNWIANERNLQRPVNVRTLQRFMHFMRNLNPFIMDHRTGRVAMTGFAYGDPFGHRGLDRGRSKRTLHTTHPGAYLEFHLPTCCTAVSVTHIAKNLQQNRVRTCSPFAIDRRSAPSNRFRKTTVLASRAMSEAKEFESCKVFR